MRSQGSKFVHSRVYATFGFSIPTTIITAQDARIFLFAEVMRQSIFLEDTLDLGLGPCCQRIEFDFPHPLLLLEKALHALLDNLCDR